MIGNLIIVKICPRCGRQGIVSQDVRDRIVGDDRMWFRIDWPARGGQYPRDHDSDTSVTIEDLFRPTSGCGYDNLGIEPDDGRDIRR